MESTQKPAKRILVLADFACNTGFGNVAQNVVSQFLLEDRVDYWVDIVGINYYGEPNSWQAFYPKVRLFSARTSSNGDLWGRSFLLELLATGEYDYLWILQDTFIVKTIAKDIHEVRGMLEGKKQFKWIYYFPFDAVPPQDWVKESVAMADCPVSYTEWGKQLCVDVDATLVDKVRVIPHGVDTKIFKPLPKEESAEFRHNYFHGHADDKHLVINVNRNQPRKDIGRTLQVIRRIKDLRMARFMPMEKDILFYLHMQPKDLGVDIVKAATSLGLEMYKDYVIPNRDYRANSFPATILNKVYNCADVLISTALGEGWGLSLTEAMATKLPVLAPNNSAITEVLGHGKYGQLVNADNPIIIANDNEVVRYQTNIASMAEWIKTRCITPDEERVEAAYEYVTTNLDWGVIGQTWRDLLFNL